MHLFLMSSGHTDTLLVQCSTLEKLNNVDVYLYFTKEFDKIDQGILLNKLRKIGINGKIGVWIHNFMSNRQQCVAINGITSSEAQVRSGVPQGLVLGPLLFLMRTYI